LNFFDAFRAAKLLPRLLVSWRLPVQQEVKVVHVEVDNGHDCNQTRRCSKNPREDGLLRTVGPEFLGSSAEDCCEEKKMNGQKYPRYSAMEGLRTGVAHICNEQRCRNHSLVERDHQDHIVRDDFVSKEE